MALEREISGGYTSTGCTGPGLWTFHTTFGPTPFDITWGEGIPEMVHWTPADYSAGKNVISRGTTSRVITLRYTGPLEALRPHVTITSLGGLARPQLYVSNKSYD